MNLTTWARRGSEGETADWAAHVRDTPSRGDVESALAAHHEADLALLPESERETAVDAMADAYIDARRARWAEVM